ncbi:MAG: inositol monophosphatase family protein [Pseudomonadota bacterium]
MTTFEASGLPALPEPLLGDEMALLLCRLALAARAETLPRFRRLPPPENKAAAGAFDPVTEADRAAEAAIRAILAETCPADAILGEEEAALAGTSGVTWVIDPIDGTRAFVAGLPTWGTLIARDDGHAASHGIVDHPVTRELFLGVTGVGAWLLGPESSAPVRASRVETLADATLISTSPDLFHGAEAEAFAVLRQMTRDTRYGTDCYGYSMVAAGCADLVVENGLAAYDIAGPKAVVEAAGGIVTDWQGGECRWGGRVVAAATPALHAAALEVLSRVPAG